jgi:DNA-binding IclR family transcriptional regulator
MAAGGETTRILLVLAALSRRPTTISQVMTLTGLALSEVSAVLVACRQWGLVGATLRLTDLGLRELSHAKGINLRDKIPLLHGSVDPYYPRSLRVGR